MDKHEPLEFTVESTASKAYPLALAESCMEQALTAQENLFVEYADHRGISLEQLLSGICKVTRVGASQSIYYYKGEPFLVMTNPKLESTPTGLVITFQYQKLWEKTNEQDTEN